MQKDCHPFCQTVSMNTTTPPAERPPLLLMRVVSRASRARWYSFLRRVFEYQNGSRSDLRSSPFNSGRWMALELSVLVVQIVGITVAMAVSREEDPAWPLRIWVVGYNAGNVVSLPILYWRYWHCRSGSSVRSGDLEEQQRSRLQGESSAHLMNKSRTFLELFFAIWFVMGNVWVFDTRNNGIGAAALHQAPKLHALCVLLLAWNAISYSFPFLLFLLLCCCVPFLSRMLGYNMNLASADKGASDDQISRLPHWRFKQLVAVEHKDEQLPNDNESECCICLAKYREMEQVRQLPCSHIFHLKCVDQWLRIISCCPLCKQELDK